jgi:para-nitrobenzyl esterase
VARELSNVQDNVYAYLFKWGGVGSGPSPFDFIYGAGHSAEISFFFGSDQGLFGYPFVPENEAGRKDLQQAMMAYLAEFARSGDPNALGSGLPKWEKWSNDEGPKAIVFDADFDNALIEMTEEELTIEGVWGELASAVSSLPANAQSAAWFFQWSQPW